MIKKFYEELEELSCRLNDIASSRFDARLVRIVCGYQKNIDSSILERDFAHMLIEARDENNLDWYANILDFFQQELFGRIGTRYQNRLYNISLFVLTGELGIVSKNQELVKLIEQTEYNTLPGMEDKKIKSLLHLHRHIENTQP